MKIVASKIIFKNKLLYPAFPSIISVDNKNFLLAFRVAPKEIQGYSHLHSLSKIKVLEIDSKFNIIREFELGGLSL